MQTEVRWSDVLKEFDKDKARLSSTDIQEVADAICKYPPYLADYDWDAVQEKIQKYWIAEWMCTDQLVGYAAYYIDGEMFAVSRQPGRKCDEHFWFISDELAKKVYDYVMSLSDNGPEYRLIELSGKVPGMV